MIQGDTISAVATAIGEGGIGIIRMSGKDSLHIGNRIFEGFKGRQVHDMASHTAAFGRIIDPDNKRPIDEVLVLVMKSPRSYTKEDVVEIHCHGGPVPLRRILELTLREGARLAESGEFTKRAFLNGRIDLSQAEAVIDIIQAKTDASLDLAMNHLHGEIATFISRLRNSILEMIAPLEAAIDFPEEDIEEITAEQVDGHLMTLIQELDQVIDTAYQGRILRDGLKTVIIGKPNVGKSSLLNALLKENRAIVTDIPGTTRDTIEEFVNIGGIPLRIIDTAGIRDTNDQVERIGVDRSKELAEKADLILLLLDASLPLSDEDRQVLSLLNKQPVFILVNKTDLPQVLNIDDLEKYSTKVPVMRISVQDGTGIDGLISAIREMVYSGGAVTRTVVSNVRHIHLLRQAAGRLIEARSAIAASLPPDCIVVDLRAAWEILGEINGQTAGEELLEQIFSRFCIGK